MPFASKAQQRFAFGTKQPWAKEFADKTDFKDLPERVGKRSTKRSQKRQQRRASSRRTSR